MRRSLRLGVLLLLSSSTGACTAIVGGSVLVGAVAIGALTSQCYDYLDVTVYDANGHKTCDATVTATTSSGNELELTSCYYTPLSNGNWTLRARLPGHPEAVSQVQVDNRKECIHHVQRVELTVGIAHAAAALNVSGAIRPSLPAAAPTLSAAPTIAPAASDSSASAGAPATDGFPEASEPAR